MFVCVCVCVYVCMCVCVCMCVYVRVYAWLPRVHLHLLHVIGGEAEAPHVFESDDGSLAAHVHVRSERCLSEECTCRVCVCVCVCVCMCV